MQSVQPDKVREALFLSSLRTEVYKDVLDANGITHVLQVGFELRPTHPSAYTYLRLPVYDIVEQDIIESFPAAFEFIDKAIASGGAVLVHCQAGVSRSASVVIGYCMWKDEMTAAAATAEVQRARSIVWPNSGFKCQLREFEAINCDASRWTGWSMQRYLHTQYGDDSMCFMNSMLGGAPVDRLRNPSSRAMPSIRPSAAAAVNVASALPVAYGTECTVVSAQQGSSPRACAVFSRPADEAGSDESDSSSSNSTETTTSICRRVGNSLQYRCANSSKAHSVHSYAGAAAAAAGVAMLHGDPGGSSVASRGDEGLVEEAALLMAG